jgi:predicted ATP-grasp superfamily ATP-dependent carboligase
MGGLDKAELFEFLMNQPESSVLPRTRILTEFRQAEDALRELGDDAVFKPALKPWDMDLSNMGAKVVTRASQLEPHQSILRRLARAWPMSKRWVAQERLRNFADGEVGVWAARAERGAIFTEFAERWKYPLHGGSGCWVESRPHGAYFPLVDRLLERLDYIGLCEVPFLADDAGQPKLIELNSRAWLQVGLAEHSGLPVIEMTLAAMSGQEPPTFTCSTEGTWINIERALQAALSGSKGPRFAALATLIRRISRGADIAVWSSPFGMVKGRWISRMIGKLLDRVRG